MKVTSTLLRVYPLFFAGGAIAAAWHHHYRWAWTLALVPVLLGPVGIGASQRLGQQLLDSAIVGAVFAAVLAALVAPFLRVA